jgi:hypothetical protein
MKRKWCPDHEWVTPPKKFHPIGLFFVPAYLIYYVAFKKGSVQSVGAEIFGPIRSSLIAPSR